MKKIKVIFALLLLAGAFVAGEAQNMDHKAMKTDKKMVMIEKAVCVIYPTAGNKVTGVVTFTKVEGGIKIVADLQGLTPGKHGFHIHEFGDCTSADGTSAGGHFNPSGVSHGGPMESMRHEGDMGNIEANSNGVAHLEYVDSAISFKGISSIIGRSIIVHEKEDDLKTQPTGNAGARIGYGVIGIAK